MQNKLLTAIFWLAASSSALAEITAAPAECVMLDNRAREIESRIMDYDVVEGQFGMTDVSAVWRAYFDRKELVYLIEHQYIGDGGEADVWFWFQDRELFRYQERAHRRLAESDEPAAFQDIERTMWFKPGGGLIEAEQTCDGVGVVPLDEETHAAYHRGMGLMTQANRAFEAQRAGERFFCAGEDPNWTATLVGRRVHFLYEGRSGEILIGRGTYTNDNKERYEWAGAAAGYKAPAAVQLAQGKCKLGEDRLPWKVSMQMPANIEVKGCCDVRPPGSLLASVDGPKRVDYGCEQGELSVWYLRGGEMAVVTIGDANYVLPREAAASGERYSDIGIVLRSEGEESSLVQGEETLYSGCQPQS